MVLDESSPVTVIVPAKKSGTAETFPANKCRSSKRSTNKRFLRLRFMMGFLLRPTTPPGRATHTYANSDLRRCRSQRHHTIYPKSDGSPSEPFSRVRIIKNRGF